MTSRRAKAEDGDDEAPLTVLLAQAEALAVSKLHQRLIEEGFEELRNRHRSVFRFIDPDGSQLTELARRSGLSKQAIGELVSELERYGYVRRTPDPSDRRAKLILLTDRGREAQIVGLGILAEIERGWAEIHSRDTIARLRRTLEQVVKHAQANGGA